VDELRRSLERRAAAVQVREEVGETKRLGTEVVVASASSPAAREMLGLSGVVMPQAAEALALVPSCVAGRQAVLACGADTGGLVYAVLELKDRVEHADSVSAALRFSAPVVERPANAIRSVARLFTSEVEDKPWLHDREFWRQYLSMLVAQRFNRISLTLGIGYDFPRRIDDAYLYFAYPFLVSTPGYDVHVRGLPQAERDMNLSMLEFVSNEAAGRGLHCQLGLWTHSYEWTESPRANYFVEGLTPDRHAAYCRDSLRALLEACPQIAGVTFRVHGESGIREGSYKFWETVFDGVAQCGRRVEIDMHAKGIDQRMIDIALATGLPVNVSPKYWAEHMGLPYQQASIRELERPPRDVHSESYMTLSAGSRQFTRYGYADLLREDRRYGVLFRLWPGTQRLLLWGDPVMAAGYGRASNFCGCQGVEFCEPLSFKGRKGSGRPDSRDGYANPSLRTEYGWKKYLYTYRLWGRLTYDPDAEADSWRRFLRTQYGPAAADAEGALANASRILPLVTTAHLPSAANNSYWPEMYTDMPVVDEARPHPYYDTPSPKRFGAVSALDPVLFASVDEFAAELATGQRSGKVSPLDVAGWLEQMAEAAGAHLARIGEVADSSWGPDLRRLMADVAIQCGLGRFFGGKLRAGVSYALYARTNDRAALHRATELYWAARDAWAELAARASVYCDDLTVGLAAHLRGHWRDRLPAIDLHIADMEQVLEQAGAAAPLATRPDSCAPDQPPPRPTCHHVPASSFRPGQPILVGLEVLIQDPSLGPTSVRLHYRHVNQAEAYVSAEMEAGPRCFRAVIPGAYSDSPYPLQYFFELRSGPGSAWLYPGLDPGTFCQPYFVVRQERHAPAMHVPGPIPKRPAS
jgi:hypothetical protein